MQDWTRDDFLLFCILSGCDYVKVQKMGPAAAYKLVQHLREKIGCTLWAPEQESTKHLLGLQHYLELLDLSKTWILVRLEGLNSLQAVINAWTAFRSSFVFRPDTLEQLHVIEPPIEGVDADMALGPRLDPSLVAE